MRKAEVPVKIADDGSNNLNFTQKGGGVYEGIVNLLMQYY